MKILLKALKPDQLNDKGKRNPDVIDLTGKNVLQKEPVKIFLK